MSDDYQPPVGRKPPDKYDILMDWFLADAKEILDRLAGQQQLTDEGRQALIAVVDDLKTLLSEIRTESIEAQRDIQRLVKSAEDTLAKASRAGVSDIEARLRQGTTRIAVTAAIAGGAGAAIGGVIVALVFPLL